MTSINTFYRMRAVTNLHVGSGETNYGVIDKLIERDAATGFPCINSSGLKGAIKQKFNDVDSKKLIEVFGSDSTKNKSKNSDRKATEKNQDKEDDTSQGKCNFLPAHLLALPVRSDKTPFFLATSPGLLKGFMDAYEDIIGSKHNSYDLAESAKGHAGKCSLPLQANQKADLGQAGEASGGLPADFVTKLQTLLGTNHPVAVISDELMIELCNDLNLPVIARNSLEDGQSKNLWYEQVLPRESVLYFPIMWDKDRSADFDLTKGMLQVGGNASVGYGFTKISVMS